MATYSSIPDWSIPWINNLRYADDTTLMAESEEELKSLLMKVKDKSGKARNQNPPPWSCMLNCREEG